MAIGTSIFLGAVGAILYWGVEDRIRGVDLGVVGIVLMVVAAIGLVWSLITAATLSRRVGDRDVVVDRDPAERL